MTARPACHDHLILRGLKKYAHVHLWTRDRTAGVKVSFARRPVVQKGTCQLTLVPKLATLVPLPFLLALDLLIFIRP